MNEDKMIDELRTLSSSETFNEWLSLLYGGKKLSITRDALINGYCIDLAYYLSVKYNVQVISMLYFNPPSNVSFIPYAIMGGHAFVRGDSGIYYDGWNVDGVVDPRELQWVKNIFDPSLGSLEDCIKIYENNDHQNDSLYLKYRPKLLEMIAGENVI